MSAKGLMKLEAKEEAEYWVNEFKKDSKGGDYDAAYERYDKDYICYICCD
jgi:hypothetical protein